MHRIPRFFKVIWNKLVKVFLGRLLNCFFKLRSKKTSKLRVTGLCAGNSPVTGEFPAQMASNAENVSVWWRHHVWGVSWLWWQSCVILSSAVRHTRLLVNIPSDILHFVTEAWWTLTLLRVRIKMCFIKEQHLKVYQRPDLIVLYRFSVDTDYAVSLFDNHPYPR